MKKVQAGVAFGRLFDKAYDAGKGFTKIELLNKCNYIKDGQILSPNLWFDGAFDFYNGFAKLYVEDKGYNYINTNGELLSPDIWFRKASSFNDNGIAKVEKDNKIYLLDTNGNLTDLK